MRRHSLLDPGPPMDTYEALDALALEAPAATRDEE
jgi:hypothetical protein